MAGFPAAGFFVLGLTGTSGATALNDWLAANKQLPGAQDETELTIASGAVAATLAQHSLDTESDAAADDLDNITVASMEGYHVLVRAENSARVVTMRHERGGAGQLSFSDGRDCVLDATTKWVLFYIDKGASPVTLREVLRGGFRQLGTLQHTALTGATTLTNKDSGRLYSNDGASAQVDVVLPAAEAGLWFEFATLEAFALQITAAAGDTIRDAGTESAAAGETQSTAAKGNVIRLVCFNATEWIVMSKQGSWTTT